MDSSVDYGRPASGIITFGLPIDLFTTNRLRVVAAPILCTLADTGSGFGAMRIGSSLRAALTLAVLLIAKLHLDAQTERAVLAFETLNGQATFHIGERIPLKLTFSSPNDTDYLIAPLVRGRGDEFDCNRFAVVSPAAGWSDPLEMYFKQDLIRTGHGWSWPPLKKSKPVEASVNLNEWIRFDQPGKYTVRVNSGCILLSRGRGGYPLTSTIDLTIIPATPEWQAEKFESIQRSLDLLDEPPPAPEPGASSQSQWEHRSQLFEGARADLKYLATPAAIDEMTKRLRSEKYNFADQCSTGLMGLPPAMRGTAIASMNKRIEEPDFPINSWFFGTLSFLHVTPGSDKESIGKQRQAANPLIWSAIFSAVKKKGPAARAETVQTLLDYGRKVDDPAIDQQMSMLLKQSFLDLDSRSQIDDLQTKWDRLKSPAFLPTLQKLARLPVESDSDLEVWVYDRQQLKGFALKRWYELDPKGAHREIVAQIGSAAPSLAGKTIAFLPEEQFPMFEPLWAKALLETKSQLRERAIGALLVRFGTGAVTSEMVAKLDEKSGYPCDAHIVALAYLVRFDPTLARQRLKQEFPGKCSGQLLRFISELATDPVLNEQAVENLDSSDPETVRDATGYLTSYSRKNDEAPLMSRYLKWTSAHRGMADPLVHPDPHRDISDWMLGEELGDALIRGQGWFADSEMIDRILKACVGEWMCKRLKDDASFAVAPYQLHLQDLAIPSGAMSTDWVGVAQYQSRSLSLFDEKIGQFPPGSKFVFGRWYRPANGDELRLEQRVRSIIEKHGMSIVDSINGEVIPSGS
ncbi:MAG TPA: hypothetical protein VGF82_19465 [Terracidiphilus sp.]